MASPRNAGENGTGDGENSVGDGFQLLAQRLAQIQEAERKVQEAERRTQEALRLQEERAAAAMREMERKLQDKGAAISAMQQRYEEILERLTGMEEQPMAPEGSGGEGGMQRLEGRVNEVEASLQSALQTFMPRVDALLRQLENPESTHASLAFDVSTPTSSGAGHQGAAADEEGRARQRVELRVREVKMNMEEARTSPSPLGVQLHGAASSGNVKDVRCLIDGGADLNFINSNGFTPLINATLKERVNVVSVLLQRGADANAVDSDGSSALHWAAMWDRSARCVSLLLGAGADVNARDRNGETPLHYAAKCNNEGVVSMLVAAGARRNLRAWDGRWRNKTPFDVAKPSRIQNLLR